jgi:hypothetical protein
MTLFRIMPGHELGDDAPCNACSLPLSAHVMPGQLCPVGEFPSMTRRILEAARVDARYAKEYGSSPNPYSTQGARGLWQDGYDNKPVANMVRTSGMWVQWYRGRCAAMLEGKP